MALRATKSNEEPARRSHVFNGLRWFFNGAVSGCSYAIIENALASKSIFSRRRHGIRRQPDWNLHRHHDRHHVQERSRHDEDKPRRQVHYRVREGCVYSVTTDQRPGG